MTTNLKMKIAGGVAFAAFCVWGYSLIFLEQNKSYPLNTLTDLSDFESIKLSGGAHVEVVPGDTHSIKIEKTRSLRVSVDENKLSIKCGIACSRQKDAKVTVTMPQIRSFAVLNGGKLTVAEAFAPVNKLDVSVMNGGALDAFKIPAKSLTVAALNGGKANVTVTGEINGSALNGGYVQYAGQPELNITATSGGRFLPADD